MTEQAETVVAETETIEETNIAEGSSVDASGETESVQASEEHSEESVGSASEDATENTETPAVEPVAEDTAAEVVAQESPAEEETSSEENLEPDEGVDEEGRVVKLLSVGQKVPGKVKRITDFGAFVDIGVGRDGLIHISELSVRRVGKVTDMLQENQDIEVWIKKLDRDRNRISLTRIEPGTKTIRELEKGELVNGTVTRILPYGAFVDIGIGRDALLHIREMSEGYVARPEDVVSVGEELEARIIELSRRRQRVDLSIKGLRPEPEAAVMPEEEAQSAEPEAPEEEVVDEFADVEVLSPMELAFKRAMEAEGIEIKGSGKKSKRRRGKQGRSIQDEIIARTLGVVSED
ncbi:MAG: S1 RNA-binding domain-containing protein [Caldilineaceae bacterium]|nr:S1 RNA-binding domain-containing protein [Caldilineaceae bacterium]